MNIVSDHSFHFEAIGTAWTIDIYSRPAELDLTLLEKKITQRINKFDSIYSRFRSDSLIYSISQKSGIFAFPDDAKELFTFYEYLYQATSGKVTPLIGDVISDSGYDASYSLTPKATIEPAKSWEQTISYKHPVLQSNEPVILDFGAAGKGYLVDIIAELIESFEVTSFSIDAGGDICMRNVENSKSRIGLEHPTDPTLAIGVVELENGSICASAGNRRKWAGYHHILDPHTTKPVQKIIATWVIAKSTMIADGIATALFFVAPSKLKNLSFEYCIVDADLKFTISKGFNAEMFRQETQ